MAAWRAERRSWEQSKYFKFAPLVMYFHNWAWPPTYLFPFPNNAILIWIQLTIRTEASGSNHFLELPTKPPVHEHGDNISYSYLHSLSPSHCPFANVNTLLFCTYEENSHLFVFKKKNTCQFTVNPSCFCVLEDQFAIVIFYLQIAHFSYLSSVILGKFFKVSTSIFLLCKTGYQKY